MTTIRAVRNGVLPALKLANGSGQAVALALGRNRVKPMHEHWPDPAGIGPDGNSRMSQAEKDAAATARHEAQATAEAPVDLEDDGQRRVAVGEWRQLFRARRPRP
jgi:hypothetical protein